MRSVHDVRAYVLALVMIMAVLSACAAPPAPAEPAQQPETQVEATEVEGPAESEEPTTLVIGLAEDTVSMDPGRAYETHSSTVHQPIYETLVTFPPDRVDEIIPGVAESWTISDDGLKYTFTLEKGRKFSTGRTLTAKDVDFSLNRMRNLKGNPSFLADNIANVEASDEHTVIITLHHPDPSLLSRLAFTAFGIIDSEEAKAHGAMAGADAAETDTAEEWLNNHSIGSGPYMMQKWEPTVETILVRNPEYVGERAAIARVIYRTMAEAAAQKIALEAGDVDIAVDVTPDQVSSLTDSPNIVVYEGVSDWTFFLLMNMDPEIGVPCRKTRCRMQCAWLWTMRAFER